LVMRLGSLFDCSDVYCGSSAILFDFFIQLLTVSFFFFFNATATTEIYTLSLHDALPIFRLFVDAVVGLGLLEDRITLQQVDPGEDRKSTRLNSSHDQISYAVFCLKKKKKNIKYHTI